MTEQPYVSDELRNRQGTQWAIGSFLIEKGMITRFCRAVGDNNPRWQAVTDGEAPPTFVLTLGGEQFGELMQNSFPDGLLHGATDLETHLPVRPRDVIETSINLSNIRERRGAENKMNAFVIFNLTYQNQRSELVATCRQTMTAYETKDV
ncbi:MaoC family dehydratase N-terminal domain-containing protein [Chloroflexota bacterium]